MTIIPPRNATSRKPKKISARFVFAVLEASFWFAICAMAAVFAAALSQFFG